ncbi:MAG: hypothetical protein QME66_10405 [Candidatus Eisenbacteria bacterium]|nr:hypothetical protein [Candidatus Eisenbacteria bacterium]
MRSRVLLADLPSKSDRLKYVRYRVHRLRYETKVAWNEYLRAERRWQRVEKRYAELRKQYREIRDEK